MSLLIHRGQCICFFGWGGVDCSAAMCCNGHGDCPIPGPKLLKPLNDNCVCVCVCGGGSYTYTQGWIAIQIQCLQPRTKTNTATNPALLVTGTCKCHEGFMGQQCEIEKKCPDPETCQRPLATPIQPSLLPQSFELDSWQ